MLTPAAITALAILALAAVGTLANEGTHGGVAEGMGLGHHHMADYGGYHCASHSGMHGSEHMAHMHGETHADHADCPGGSEMHGMDHMGDA